MSMISGKLAWINYTAAENHFGNLGVSLKSLRWIFAKQQQVCTFANLHGADVIIQAQGSRIGQSCRVEYLAGRYTGVDEPLHLEPGVETGRIGVDGAALRIGRKQQACPTLRELPSGSFDSANTDRIVSLHRGFQSVGVGSCSGCKLGCKRVAKPLPLLTPVPIDQTRREDPCEHRIGEK